MPIQIMQAAEVDRRLVRAGSLSSESSSSSIDNIYGSSDSERETGEAPPPHKKKKKEDPILTRTGVTMETVLDLSLGDEEPNSLVHDLQE